MAKLHISLDNHDGPYTVREMRKRLAQVLSKLNGDQEVRFMFTAALDAYTPRTVHTPRDFSRSILDSGVVLGELARPEND